MGGLCSTTTSDYSPSSAVIDGTIDDNLAYEAELLKHTHRVLLLGTGESGKSTIFNQLQTLYGPPGQEKFRTPSADIVSMLHENVLDCLNSLSFVVEYSNPKWGENNPEHKETVDYIKNLRLMLQVRIAADKVDAIIALLDTPVWKQARKSRHQVWTLCNSDYYLDNIKRFCEPKFRPTIEDRLYARLRTLGVQEITLMYHKQIKNSIDITVEGKVFGPLKPEVGTLTPTITKPIVIGTSSSGVVSEISTTHASEPTSLRNSPMHIRDPRSVISAVRTNSTIKLKPIETRVTLIDVGGQRTERKKWLSCFRDGISAVIYVINLNCFNQVLMEDATVNRMIESINLFRELMHGKELENVPIVLIMNKFDLLKREIISDGRQLKDVKDVEGNLLFPGSEYLLPSSPQAIVDYFVAIFRNQVRAPRRENLHYFVMTALDTSDVDRIYRTFREKVLKI